MQPNQLIGFNPQRASEAIPTHEKLVTNAHATMVSIPNGHQRPSQLVAMM